MAKEQKKKKGGSFTSPISQVQKFLNGMDYPAKKQDLVDLAEKNGADRNMLDALERIPDRVYKKPTEVSAAIVRP